MKLYSEINNISTKLHLQLKSVEAELSNLPDGRLTQEMHQSIATLVWEQYIDGKRHRTSVTLKDQIVGKLLRKEALEKEKLILERNIGIIDKAFSKIIEYDMFDLVIKISERINIIPKGEILTYVSENMYDNEWAADNFEQSTYMSEAKRHITKKGLKVRSKSEALIADMLDDHSIPFRYEQILHIDDLAFAPDFTIKRDDGKIVYWEHMGMMKDKNYANTQEKKLKAYAFAGIVPWDNLIVTYDDMFGNIDLRIIESEIVNKLELI